MITSEWDESSTAVFLNEEIEFDDRIEIANDISPSQNSEYNVRYSF